ncbi:chaperone NapD [Saccharophagus sp. K07]|jgi:nitrate reductase NapD|uniref:chaperone NapD n=1 Tax=Saccharophagus sp. K07 TaxID=2283636 RepID=UPI001CA36B35|nr:chaperone NapD [Saccharophagus sp. K07]
MACLIATDMPKNKPLHIASVIVHVWPKYMPAVKHWLGHVPGAEIHAESAQGKLVVVIEADSERTILNTLDDLAAQPGCLSAALVYHEILTEEPEQP